jgi:DNA-binding beta-propeller fold protein YncE
VSEHVKQTGLTLGRLAAVATLVAGMSVALQSSKGPTSAQRQPAAAKPASGGTGTMYVSSYKGVIFEIDEATEKLVAEIPVKSGMPGTVRFSNDRSRLYIRDVTYEKIEVIDRVKRTTIDTYTLSEGATKTRIWSLQPDPNDKYLILVVKNYTLNGDRWEIGPPTLVQYDLAARKIAKTIPWPKGEEREGVGVIFSPDGKLLYMFAEDILIYETDKFTEVDRWNLAQPQESGVGRISLGGMDPFSDDPGFYTGLLTMQDPINNRRIMGLGRVDLAAKKIDFRSIGPSRGMAFGFNRDKRRGYGLAFGGINENEFWTFDLETYRVVGRTQFTGRPRMGMRVSSNGNYIYIHTAGNTIDLYDTTSFKLQRTITLDGDMTGFTLLPPPKPAAR